MSFKEHRETQQLDEAKNSDEYARAIKVAKKNMKRWVDAKIDNVYDEISGWGLPVDYDSDKLTGEEEERLSQEIMQMTNKEVKKQL